MKIIRCKLFLVICALGILFICDTGMPALVDSGSKRSVRLNTYNDWDFKNDDGWTRDEMIDVLACKENVRVSEGWPPDIGPAVKARNPTVTLYMHYLLCVKYVNDSDGPDPSTLERLMTPLTKTAIDKNDWWLRDGNGDIVKESDGVWFLDVGKPGFKEKYLSTLLLRLRGRQADGVDLDYWCQALNASYLGAFMKNRPMPAAYPTDQVWFDKAWKPFVHYVTTGLRSAGYRLIGNSAGEYHSGNAMQDWQRTQVDGVVYEQWAVGSNGEWLPGSTIATRIGRMTADPLEVWTADFGLQTKISDYERKADVALVMYYVAIPQSQLKRSYNHTAAGKVFWSPTWSFYIGEPAAKAVRNAGQYFWSRRYTRGIVLLNYEEARTVKYRLSGNYYDISGKRFSGEVDVEPHSALILASEK